MAKSNEDKKTQSKGQTPAAHWQQDYTGLRNVLTDVIEQLQDIVDGRPAEGAEVMLALRHVQDARMRLGVAKTLAKGDNPYQRD